MLIRLRRTLTTLSLAVAGVAILTIAASAQAVRYVSSNGANANPCTREAPCRNLQRGIKATPAGGELQILDSGAYGNAVTIGKSITISAVGVAATVGKIKIDAPGATVVLRGLLLNGISAPDPVVGIDIASAARVHIAGCEVERFSHGIRILASNAELVVADSVIRENGSGLTVISSAADARLTIEDSRFENNGLDGINVAGNAAVAITRVVASGNSGAGIANSGGRVSISSTTAAGNGGPGFFVFSAGQMTVDSSSASGNGAAGLFVSAGGVGRVSNSTFTNNDFGLRSIGTLESRGNNMVRGNVTSQTQGTITTIPGT